MTINSKRKGKTGELQAAHYLNEVFGGNARRGQQFSGGPESPDIMGSIEGLHFEIKLTQRLQLHQALDQADNERSESEIPVVMYRRNRSPWYWIVKVDDIPALGDLVEKHLKKNITKPTVQDLVKDCLSKKSTSI